jgi:PrtD family type I secretion system ABC transporter
MRDTCEITARHGASELDAALANTNSAFAVVAIFSLVINVLMLTGSIYMLQVMDRVLSSGHTETLLFLTMMAGFAILVMCVLDTLRTAVTIRIGGWLNDRLGPVFLGTGVRARLKGAADGAEPLRDVSQLRAFIANQGLIAFFDSPWVPFFVVVIWVLHPLLGSFALFSALLLLGLAIANQQVTQKPTEAANRAQIDATRLAEATIRNAEAVQAMGLLPAMTERWRRVNEAATEALRTAGEAGGVVISLTKFVRHFVQVAILGLGAWLVVKHEITAGGMIAASILLGRALAPVELAIGAWKNFIVARLAYKRLKAHIERYAPEPPRVRLPAPSGRLTVHDLSYLAPGSGQLILGNLSFDVEPGEALAVIGPSGAGKSTLCRLLVGLAEPAAGEVRLDGSDVRHWDPAQLGRHIGYLPQDVELFDGTVRENIARMGPADDCEVTEAAIAARAHPVIQGLPQGYDTRIGADGIGLSGGQRQRVGLARAMFADPRIVVLDEPNANLDEAGEAALVEAIWELKARCCALVIVGHRPSTLEAADKILLLRQGSVAMFGPRDEVLDALSGGADNGDSNHAHGGPQLRCVGQPCGSRL